MPHRNAPLTETGRLRLARCVVDDGWTLRRGLNQGRGIRRDLTPENAISEEPDGSAPSEPLPGWDEPEPDATP